MANKRSRTDETLSIADALVSAGVDSRAARLVAGLPHRMLQLDPRRPFREAGAARDELIIVLGGIVSCYKADASGGRQIVALRFPGESILPSDRPAECHIQAIVRSTVAIAKAQDFKQLIEDHPELNQSFWRLLQRDEAVAQEWLVNCGRRDSIARVAHLLCETAVRMHAGNQRLVNPFTQQQIADITGQTSVNVNRVLADLERQGVIERNMREIAFADWEEMRRVASFQPAYLTV